MRAFIVGALAVGLFAAGAHAQNSVYDPWEGANRGLFRVHNAVDEAVITPVARGYRSVTNEPIRGGVSNFLDNLRSPVVFANDVLQGELGRAGVTAARFGVNTTLGIVGVFDPASGMGLERHDEDFGQTLAVWGVGAGPYVFVPLLGPTTIRDGAGRIVDIAFDPLHWAEFEGDDTVRTTRTVVGAVAARESVLDTVEALRRDSLDPYTSIRTSYGLLRQSLIENGVTDVQALPEFQDVPSDAPVTPPSPQPPAPGVSQ